MVVERRLHVARAQLHVVIAAAAASVAVAEAGTIPGHAERRAQRRGGGHLEVPHRQLDGDVLRHAAAHVQRAGVLAGRRALRGVHVDEHRAALVRRNAEGERIALLAGDRIDVRNQRVRPHAGGAVAARPLRHVEQRLAVEDHVAARDGVSRAVPERVDAHRHAIGLAGDDHLECFKFVLRGGDLRGRGGACRGLGAGADLLCGRSDPDLGGGCGTGGEQSDEQGERLHY